MALDIVGKEGHYLAVIGSLYLLTGRHWPDQTGYSHLQVREGQSSRVFVLHSIPEAKYLLVWPE